MTVAVVIFLFILALVGCGVLLYFLNDKFYGDGFQFGLRNFRDSRILRKADRINRLRRNRLRRRRRYRRKLDRKFERQLG